MNRRSDWWKNVVFKEVSLIERFLFHSRHTRLFPFFTESQKWIRIILKFKFCQVVLKKLYHFETKFLFSQFKNTFFVNYFFFKINDELSPSSSLPSAHNTYKTDKFILKKPALLFLPKNVKKCWMMMIIGIEAVMMNWINAKWPFLSYSHSALSSWFCLTSNCFLFSDPTERSAANLLTQKI